MFAGYQTSVWFDFQISECATLLFILSNATCPKMDHKNSGRPRELGREGQKALRFLFFGWGLLIANTVDKIKEEES